VLLDGTDSNSTMVAMSYVTRIIASYGQQLGGARVTAVPLPISVETRAWYNPDLRSRNYNVPGVIAIMIMLICLTLTSMSVVREREIGTIEQLMVTPLRPIELILGKTLPFAAIGFFDMCLVTAVGVFWFNIPIKGSFPLLGLATTIYLLSVLGFGLFISTIAKTQQQALMATFLFFAPAILLSGFMFPIENMPAIFQYATYLNPLRYFLVIIRGIFLKGNGLDLLWQQMLSLLVLGLVLMTLSALRFKKRLG
jgi:ABC-2 type transport system permease protein